MLVFAPSYGLGIVWGGTRDWRVSRARLHASIPSAWGMLVYRELISKMHPGGSPNGMNLDE